MQRADAEKMAAEYNAKAPPGVRYVAVENDPARTYTPKARRMSLLDHTHGGWYVRRETGA